MTIKIRTKLVFWITLILAVLFSVTAFLLIDEKKKELSDDIFINTLAFSRLTSNSFVSNYELFLIPNNFINFNRSTKEILSQSSEISSVSIISYGGEILYDSKSDLDKKYDGDKRLIVDKDLNDQIISKLNSFKTVDGKIVFMKIDNLTGTIDYVDKFGGINAAIKEPFKIEYFVIPVNEKYSVQLFVNYNGLDDRVEKMVLRIVLLALFGLILGTIFAIYMSSNITKPVTTLVTGVQEIAKGNFNAQVDIQSNDEIKYLGEAFNRMARDLAASINAKLFKERVVRELELARQIQRQIVPEKIPPINGLEISADLIPAGEIGGDMYDFLPYDENRMLFYLGDVTGHGVPAGILSSVASALFFGFRNISDLKEIMVNVNSVFKAKTMSNMFMTLCLMHWDNLINKFSYVSAGHEQIIHYNASNNTVNLEPAGGVALGMLKDLGKMIRVQDISLTTGDFLVIYSDGIPECWKNSSEYFGMERLLKSVAEHSPHCNTPQELRDHLLNDIKVFSEGYKQMDDITIIVIKKT